MNRVLSFILVFALIGGSYTSIAQSGSGDCKNGFRQVDGTVEFTKKVSVTIEQNLKKEGLLSSEARGYAILISAMIGSAAAATYLTSALSGRFLFLSHFLSQVSTLGIYVFGAPIWEPMSSWFRKKGFGMRRSDDTLSSSDDLGLEKTWTKTQEFYSLNAQMSRNVLNQFIISIQQNFYEAYRAARSSNEKYAAAQIAEAAFRLRTLFKELLPDEPSVAAVVKSTFTNHIVVDAEFAALVIEGLKELDSSYEVVEVKTYYSQLLATWLGSDY